MVSRSMIVMFCTPVRARFLRSSQPTPPAPTTRMRDLVTFADTAGPYMASREAGQDGMVLVTIVRNDKRG